MVGRDTILADARQTLTEGTSVLLEGDAGIGKTAVWRALVDDARRRDCLVLACAPTEAEAALPFAALADLIRPLRDLVPALPPPQRAAADAVLLTDFPEEVVDERAIGAATRSLLERAARPLLVAVDDAPWLDQPSERAIRFALRRLAPRPPALVACRTSGTAPTAAALDLDDARRVALAPLGAGALHQIIRDRLGGTLSRSLLARIARDAGGNPLLAIELARAVLRLPRPPGPGEDLPVVASMRQLVADATRALPPAGQAAVRLAALLTVPTVDDLVSAGVVAADLDPAEEAGLLTVTGNGISFAHPVYASTVRAGIPAATRRRMRRTLAGAVADPDERARQLAQCTTGPDPAVAAELAAAAHRQRARGAPAVAADLYERAAELAGPDADEWRLAAVRCRFDCGDYTAAGVAADAAARALTGDARAEALLLRAMVAWGADDLGGAVEAAEASLAAAGTGSPLEGRIQAHLSMFQELPERGRDHAHAAIALLSEEGSERPLLCAALLNLFFHEVRGGVARTDLLDRALALEDGTPSWLSGTIPAIWWKGVDDHGRARDRLHGLLAHATALGDEPWQHEVLTHLGETELLAGRFTAAEKHIAAARELGEMLGTGLVGETWLGGTLDAYRGRLDAADAVVEAGLTRGRANDDPWCLRIHLHLAAFVQLSRGRPAEAATTYRELATLLGELGVVEPITQRFEPDWIEACVGAGDLDTARRVLQRLTDRHDRLPRPWTTLGLARSRVLLDTATGADPLPALAALADARAAVPADVLPVDRARCLLVAGMAHRRGRRKREARAALETAAAEFTALGAAAFADRAAAELTRTTGRTASATELTPTELRVARLAAQGQTNRAIADALFISPKTVEANLARAYRKLGITNRAQLAVTMTRLPD
ncbi:AAA ATPase domain-containing protein [Asanoa hainanensis]|uniref:AAA ATPase domain-containing protein n=1 Tax=Asanoa hainanensis TaxID=560556 RepID=A0A239L6E4_9ACTN|nr:LuxR family transcriptional regulator [Asanoa hainanensis]SNT25423.1 AAA ATPase domain-containing protein [Asanoa hainanensis]